MRDIILMLVFIIYEYSNIFINYFSIIFIKALVSSLWIDSWH